MQGRVVHALIRREVDVYRAQGLPEEALELLDNTLRSNPALPEAVKAGFQAQMRQLQAEISGELPGDQAAVSDEQIEVIRRGWDGSDAIEDHFECAACLHALGRCEDALAEFATAAAKGLSLNRILPQLADCLARAYPPPVLPDEAARLAGTILPNPTPDTVFLFELVMAELMAGDGHPEHAAALTRRLVVAGAVPERYRVRLRTLAERSIGAAAPSGLPSLRNRLTAWLRRACGRG
jgi:hypothetical protein